MLAKGAIGAYITKKNPSYKIRGIYGGFASGWLTVVLSAYQTPGLKNLHLHEIQHENFLIIMN